MRYLRYYEHEEHEIVDDYSVFANREDIITCVKDILAELSDDYFDISVYSKKSTPKGTSHLFWGFRDNGYNLVVGILKDAHAGLAGEFDLSEIKEHIRGVIKYMESNDYKLADVQAFDLSKNIKVPMSLDEWVDQKVLGINFYFN